MAAYIEDYALVGDCRTGALISRTGDVDWLCVPRFDSASIFGSLLGKPDHGSWHLAPTDLDATVSRRYDGETLILVTRWETSTGVAEVHEFMPIDGGRVDLVRRVVGISGKVEIDTELRMRFDYSRVVPWVLQHGDDEHPALRAVAGPDAVIVRGIALKATDHVHRATTTVREGQTLDLVLTWYHSYREEPEPLDVDKALHAFDRHGGKAVLFGRLVPALRIPDGRVMIESAAMMIYLADLAPAAGLAPAEHEEPDEPDPDTVTDDTDTDADDGQLATLLKLTFCKWQWSH